MPYFIVHILFNFAAIKRLLFYVAPFFNATTLVAHIKKFYSDFALHNKNQTTKRTVHLVLRLGSAEFRLFSQIFTRFFLNSHSVPLILTQYSRILLEWLNYNLNSQRFTIILVKTPFLHLKDFILCASNYRGGGGQSQ